jgi:hypothetical protein
LIKIKTLSFARQRFLNCGKLVVSLILALLVSNAARGLASGLARGLALATATVVNGLCDILSFNSLNSAHF